jgi:hypothetical protein
MARKKNKSKTVSEILRQIAEGLQNKRWGWERTQDGVVITAYWWYPLREGEYCKKFYCLGDKPKLPVELQQRDDWSFDEPLNDDQKKLVLFFTDGLWDMPFLTDFLRTNCNTVGPEQLDWRNICKRLVWLAEKLGIEPDNIQKYPDLTFSKWQRQTEKSASGGKTEQNATAAKIINIGNFKGVLGDVQARNLQIAQDAYIHEQLVPEEKKKGILRKIPRWIYYILGTLAALVGILHRLGLLEPIKRLFTR